MIAPSIVTWVFCYALFDCNVFGHLVVSDSNVHCTGAEIVNADKGVRCVPCDLEWRRANFDRLNDKCVGKGCKGSIHVELRRDQLSNTPFRIPL